ncbi:tail fiber protein [Xenorhabdus sp. 38]|nr:tail fiber protein [Xenorhabdus sp. 38]
MYSLSPRRHIQPILSSSLFMTCGITIYLPEKRLQSTILQPQLQEGSGRTQTIRMVLIVSHTDAVTLKIDPSVVLATREYTDAAVKKAIDDHEKSRRHPDATLKEKGFVVLSNAVNSESETQAATPKSVKTAYDLAVMANNNANGRLEKAKNGADIPNRATFVKNIGAQPAGNYVAIKPRALDGSTLISDQLMNGFGVAIRGSLPIPADAPAVDGAIKVVQIGNNAWPTLIAFSAYENKMFIRTRKANNGSWNDWLDITDYVTNTVFTTALDEMRRLTSTAKQQADKAILGLGQTWQNVTAKRGSGGVYTNNTGKTIMVAINIDSSVESTIVGYIDSHEVLRNGWYAPKGGGGSVSGYLVVPHNAQYRFIVDGACIKNWLELR